MTGQSPPVLLIEDTPSLQIVYGSLLRGGGLNVQIAGSSRDALTQFRTLAPEVVLLDLSLPDDDGIALISKCLAINPDARIIVIAASSAVAAAMEALRAGAHDFLIKPFEEVRFLECVAGAMKETRARSPVRLARQPLAGFIGSSTAMQQVYEKVRSLAQSSATVLITGESGTGKELCARAIHACSPRSEQPFCAINCTGITVEQLEAELFGAGIDTPPLPGESRSCAATLAEGGTLFLDEICTLCPEAQTLLLRFLQAREDCRANQDATLRILCATNANPQTEVQQGRLRSDLYYRLNVLALHMPPLRARGDDVIAIAETLLKRYAAEENRGFITLSGDVKALFLSHPWPGNVRQLQNVLRNVVVLHDAPAVTAAMLPEALLARPALPERGALAAASPRSAGSHLIGKTLAEIEQIVIEETIERNGGSVPRAARVLDVSPSTLYRKREAWAKQES